ncbi:MAG: RNA polymerase sigma factor [Pirellulaceae bacterium]
MQRFASQPESSTNASERAGGRSEDQALVQRLVTGETEAWQTFLAQYSGLVRARVADVAVSFGRGNDGNAIDDAAADVVAALVQNEFAALKAFAGRSALSTYLAVIATRLSTRAYAAKRINTQADQKAVVGSYGTAPAAQTVLDERALEPIQRLLRKERKSELKRVLQELPEKQRKVVELFHLHGRSYADISGLLEIPIGSVGVTLKRTEAKLRELLEPD